MEPARRQDDPKGDIDGEHRVQMALVAALEQGLAMGRDIGLLRQILRQLIDYTDIHFTSEQMLMRLYAYPHLDAHQASHESLIQRVRHMADDFCSEEISGISSDLLLLKQWLQEHIRTDDFAFQAFLAEI